MMKLPVLMTLLVLLLQLVFVISNDNKAAADTITKRNAPFNETRETYLEILRGRDGRDGLPGRDGRKGAKGERGERGPVGTKSANGGGGVVYTRWGRTSCPSSTGATLLYEGIIGGSHYQNKGGGANNVCLPKTPQYLGTSKPPHYSQMYGTKYYEVNNIFSGKNAYNAPCAVCYTSSKVVKVMIPARTSCPSSWTVEYKGYLMAERDVHARNSVYECVDENAESISGSWGHNLGGLLYFTLTTCTGLSCPPYVKDRPITCVVCTK